MFNNNPFVLINSYVQNTSQKFVLHMLDHYGVAVARWPLICSHILLIRLTLLHLYKPFNEMKTAGNIITFIIFFVLTWLVFTLPAKKQLQLEKRGKYQIYNAEAENWASSFILKSMLLIFFGFLAAMNLNMIIKEGISLTALIGIISCFVFVALHYLMGCYTRDREPPYKASLASPRPRTLWITSQK